MNATFEDDQSEHDCEQLAAVRHEREKSVSHLRWLIREYDHAVDMPILWTIGSGFLLFLIGLGAFMWAVSTHALPKYGDDGSAIRILILFGFFAPVLLIIPCNILAKRFYRRYGEKAIEGLRLELVDDSGKVALMALSLRDSFLAKRIKKLVS